MDDLRPAPESAIYIETSEGIVDIKGKGAFVQQMFGPLSQLLASIVPTQLGLGGKFEFRSTPPKVEAPADAPKV